jgi:hypothetical protein
MNGQGSSVLCRVSIEQVIGWFAPPFDFPTFPILMNSRLLPALCVVAFAAVAIYLLGVGRYGGEGDPGVADSPVVPGPRNGNDLLQFKGQPASEPTEIANMVALAEQLNDEDATAQDDVAVLVELIRVYTRSMGAVPEGGLNEEIVHGLLGNNPKKLVFMKKDHAKINEQGELLDRFGVPYDFHPVSAELLEIRSAGPDRLIFTSDDVVPQ